MFDYRLALMTGVDFPIPELQLCIHQPTIKEISMLGEEVFFMGVQLLSINKDMYGEDELLLKGTSNFQLFMMMMNETVFQDRKNEVLAVLDLFFPNAKVAITPRSLIINHDDIISIIDEGNFEILQQIVGQICCLKQEQEDKFNPESEQAKEIAAALMKARKKTAEAKNLERGNESMLGQYLSILTVGVNSMSLKDCIELTLFQVHDLVERYSLYMNWDLDIRSRLMGAKGDKPVENWMKPIHKN